MRKAISLNFIKQSLRNNGETEKVDIVERFQNPEDRPYEEKSGSVALYSSDNYDEDGIIKTNTEEHPNQSNLSLLVIHGEAMMSLIHSLYDKAIDEA